MTITHRFLPSRLFLASVIGNVVVATSLAQSVWNNPLGGDISLQANWTGPVVSATQSGVFNLNNTYTVSVLNDFTVLDLGVNAGNVSISVAAARVLHFNGAFQVGTGATATFAGPGTMQVDSYIALGTNGNGTYKLDGGTLLIGGTDGIRQGPGIGTFNFASGVIRVLGSDLTTSVNTNLLPRINALDASRIDTNGLNATWSGNLTAAGLHQAAEGGNALIKEGLGTLTLSGASRVFDTFAVVRGTARQTTGATSALELIIGSQVGTTSSYVMEGGSLLIKNSTLADNTTAVVGSFRVGEFGGTGTLTQTAGSIASGGAVNIGNQGGTGTYNMSGGTLDVGNGAAPNTSSLTIARSRDTNATATNGTMNISGNAAVHLYLNAPFLIGGDTVPISSPDRAVGTVTQSGLSTVQVDSYVALGQNGTGTYNLNGGTLLIGGTNGIRQGSGIGTFNFSSGVIRVLGSDLTTNVNTNLLPRQNVLDVTRIDTNGLNATWSGNLTAAGLHQVENGGNALAKEGLGTLTFSGASRVFDTFAVIRGTAQQTTGATSALEVIVGTQVGSGAFVMDGGSLLIKESTLADNTTAVAGSFRVGEFGGTGTLTQTGGAIDSRGGTNIGNQGGTGTYNMSGGTLDVGNGAANETSALVIARSRDGNATATNGTMNISGNAAVHLYPGVPFLIGGDTVPISSPDRAVGTVTQSGTSTVRVESYLALGQNGTGTYNLNGGTLEIGGADGIRQGNGIGAFNFTGGVIRVIGSDLTSSVNVSLIPRQTLVDISRIDTDGLNAAWSGNLTAAGLHQAGDGGNALVKQGAGTLTFSGASRVFDTFAVINGTAQQTTGATSALELIVSTQFGTGSYVMDGGSLLIKESTLADNTTAVAGSFRVGDFGGTGTFTQNAGTVTVGGIASPQKDAAINIGNQGGTGTYNLNGGTLTLSGPNSLNVLGRSSGTNAAGTGVLNIAQSGGVPTLLELTAGSKLINGNNTAATNLGTGTINQNGGTVRVTDGTLYVAGFGNGTYNFNAGTIEVGGTGLQARYANGSSTSTFNFSSGVIRVIGSDLTTDVNANLLPRQTFLDLPRIDTNGLNATWSGNLTAPGLHQAANGGNALIKEGVGTLTFSGASRVFDTFAVLRGTARQTTGATSALELIVGTQAGTSSYVVDGGSLLIKTSTLADNTTAVPGSFRVGEFGGAGILTQTAGAIDSRGSVNIGNQGGTGTYNMSGGTLDVGNGAAPNTSTLVIARSRDTNATATNGTMNISGTAAVHLYPNAPFLVGGDTFPISSPDRAVGTVTQSGTSTVQVESYLALGSNGTGTYNLNGGTLQIGGADGIRQGPTGIGVFNFGEGEIQVIGSDLSTSLNTNLVAPAGSGLDTNGLSASLTGVLSGLGALEKEGIGNLILSGANTYSGGTSVIAGILTANGPTALGTGNVTFASSAVFSLGGSNIIKLTLGSGADLNLTSTTVRVNIASPTQFDSIAGNGLQSLATFTNSALDFTGSNLSAGSFPIITSFTQLNGNLAITGYNTSEFSASYAAGVVTFTAIPEPNGVLLLAIGALGLAAYRRREGKTPLRS